MEKRGNLTTLFVLLLITLAVAYFWDKIPFIKDSVYFILDPTAGRLIRWNLVLGMSLIVLIITLIMTLFQKYATDQKTIKELKKEQKLLQEEMKKYRSNPEKMLELNKKQMEFFGKMMPLTMRPIVYTIIPIMLFFRWFSDFFTAIGNPKILGVNWFIFYLISSLVFSLIL